LARNTEENAEQSNGQHSEGSDAIKRSIPVSGHFEDWFLEYASYVILERAVPHVHDGLKPVQRRILHALREMDDGRFHKVANVIGQTMQYHPHGDAAIGDALVNMGQKDLLIETQGNWGDVRTGDSAAAPRYIEGKLSKLALDIAFNPKITEWQLSYDGRKNEPITLPVKFPLLLAQGVEGIAVGLATKILPHNFIELCQGAIRVLQGKPTKILPDFSNGGIADVSDYKRGKRGGKIRVRSHIEQVDKKTLAIRDIPYGCTTSSLIDSIIKANDKGKIKIKQVVDNTAAEVEILVEIASGVSPEVTLDALYAFTQCEVSISPNACVILDDKPQFLSVDEILAICTEHSKELLRQELEIRKHELEERWHFASLEKIFIENRIYRDIEECETWESVIETIDVGLDPFKPQLHREVTRDDIIRLTEIKIKRISKYDSFKADESLLKLEEDLAQVKHDLKHLTDFTIAWYQMLIDKYGEGKERKTELKSFETVQARSVAAANAKLYINRKDGFIGYGLKRDEFVEECSDIDDVIVFRKDGRMMITRIADKKFVGKDILYASVWKKGDERKTYHMIYADIKASKNYAKRFSVTAATRDKEYDLSKSEKAKVHYLSANPNGESEIVQVQLSQGVSARKKSFDFDFGELGIKARTSKGNIVTKYSIRSVQRKELGQSTLGGRKIWLDEATGRLNTEERGRMLGEFDTGEQIVQIHKDGQYEMSSFDLSNRFSMSDILAIEKFEAEKIWSLIYQDGASKNTYIKRFQLEGGVVGRKYPLVNEHSGTKVLFLSGDPNPVIQYFVRTTGRAKEEMEARLSELIDVKGWKAQGNRFSNQSIIGKIRQILSGEDEIEIEDNIEEAEAIEQDSKPRARSKSTKAASSRTGAPRKGAARTSKSSNDQGLEAGDSLEWDLDKPEQKPTKSTVRRKSKKKDDDDGSGQGELF
jgi:topoisomerase-4 subunit A